MTETFHIRQPVLRVQVNGVDLPRARAAKVTFSFALRTSQATVLCLETPGAGGALREWDWIAIWMGASAAGTRLRFAGYVVRIRHDLHPHLVTLVCRGPLVRAERVHGRATEAEPDGIDLSSGGAGQTDQAIVQQVLEACGVPNLSIGGTGTVIGTRAEGQLCWGPQQSGMSFVEDLDEISLGYRTFNTPPGSTVRVPVTGTPATTPAVTFAEGVDVERAEGETDVLEVVNEVTVVGYDGILYTASQDSPFLPGGVDAVPDRFENPKIERAFASDPGDGFSCEDVAKWQLGERNRKRHVVQLTTPRDDLLFPSMVVGIVAPTRLATGTANEAERFWLQEVTTEIDERGVFSQHLTCLGGPGSDAPVDDRYAPLADFAVLIEVESVIVGGASVLRYFVHCEDTSIGRAAAVVSWSWTASAGTPSSGTGRRFTTVLDAIAGATVALEVADASGRTGSIVKSLSEAVPDQRVVARRLAIAATAQAEAWDGTAYHTASPPVGEVTVAANGPLWAAGPNLLRAADYLATAPVVSQPFGPGAAITAIWVETDADASKVAIGAADGRIALSGDGGETFAVKDGPSNEAVLRIVLSRFVAGQVHVLTPSGYYVSDNDGDGWRLVRAAATGQTFRDLALSHTRNAIASSVAGAGSGAPLERAEDGTPFTFPGLTPAVTDVVAVVGDIAEDTFYCVDAAGRTFVTQASGGTAMIQGADLPDPAQPRERGVWRDGAIKGLLYVANGTAGLYKSVDGFASSGGYYQLRAPGVDGADASADYVVVGADGLLTRWLVETTAIVSNTNDVVCLNLWNGSSNDVEPFGWQDLDFDDSEWTAAAASIDSQATAPSGATKLWDDSGTTSNPERVLFRHVFALGSGIVTSARILISNDDYAALWLNNVHIYLDTEADPGSGEASHTPRSFTVDPAILRPGANNVIAAYAEHLGNAGAEAIAWRLEVNSL